MQTIIHRIPTILLIPLTNTCKYYIMRVLMVCPEYPPMNGGIGRYTANLSKELRRLGLDVFIVCNENGDGDFAGLAPTNEQNSETLLKIVKDARPDIVHIQFEPGLYGLEFDIKNPRKIKTYIDLFYTKCKDTPIVTTFHTGYNVRQWLSTATLVKKHGRIGKFGIPLRYLIRLCKYLLNHQAFMNLSKEKILLSDESIVFSRYMSNLLGGGRVIYHGAESSVIPKPSKKEARAFFSLPLEGKIALVTGFRTATKGWDIIKLMNLPPNWTIVTNSSKSYFNTENYDTDWSIVGNNKINYIVDLERDYLNDIEYSMLFYAADVLILPYKVTSGSGVMFDGLAHGLPFIATDLGFFEEFSKIGLGITVGRNPQEFSEAVIDIESNYSRYVDTVDSFKPQLRWSEIAKEHGIVYESVTKARQNTFRS